MPQNRRVFFQESAVVASAALASNQLAAAPQVDSPEKVTMKSFRQKLLHCLGGITPPFCRHGLISFFLICGESLHGRCYRYN